MSCFARYVFIVLIAGGNWDNAASCGSRGRKSNNVRSNVNANISGRGSIQKMTIDDSGLEQGSSVLLAEHISLTGMSENKRREAGSSSP